MQRVNLGKPYEEYIKKLVKEGYYASASEVLRDALREKMKQPLIKEERKTLQELVHEGIEDVKAGRVRPYNKKLLKMQKKMLNMVSRFRLIFDHDL